MPPQHIRLIASDMDGTLLRADKTISAYTRKILDQVRERGITFVLATGRHPHSMCPLARELGMSGLAICCNGAVVFDLDRDTVVQHTSIAPAVALNVVERLRAAMPGIAFACEVENMAFGCEPGYAALRNIPSGQGNWQAEIGELCALPILKLLVLHPILTSLDMLEIAAEAAGDAVICTRSDLPFIEISAAGVDKGTALAQLCATQGIAAEEVVAFGDMPNDLAMLAWADCGVAVANADPLVIAAADAVTCSNDEDGVARKIAAMLDLDQRHI
jgi:Cof subfamily protein (haloacid dehalogenase superfamily)